MSVRKLYTQDEQDALRRVLAKLVRVVWCQNCGARFRGAPMVGRGVEVGVADRTGTRSPAVAP